MATAAVKPAGIATTPAATAAGAGAAAVAATSPASREVVRAAMKAEATEAVAASAAEAAPSTGPTRGERRTNTARATCAGTAASLTEAKEAAKPAAAYRAVKENAVAVPLLSHSASSSVASAAANDARKPRPAAAAAASSKRSDTAAGHARSKRKITPVTVVAEHFSLAIRSRGRIPCLPAPCTALRRRGVTKSAGRGPQQQRDADNKSYHCDIGKEEDEVEKACATGSGGHRCHEETHKEKWRISRRRTREDASLATAAAHGKSRKEEAAPAARGCAENECSRAATLLRAAEAGAAAAPTAAGIAPASQACPGMPLASFLQRPATLRQSSCIARVSSAGGAAASRLASAPGAEAQVRAAAGRRDFAALAGHGGDAVEGGKKAAGAGGSRSGRSWTSDAAQREDRSTGAGDKEEGGLYKLILKDITLYAPPGEVLVIMGPSGSGKTTLLNALAGRSLPSSRVMHQGSICYLGVPREEPLTSYVTYVMQKDCIPEFLTVHEYISCYARLKMKDSSEEERGRRVNEVLHELGLWKSRHTIVGGSMRKGLSGGEIKRLAVAVELLHNPSVIFLDEPTSGLDAALAFETMKLLLRLAKQGSRTIICTIHQPRSQLFAMFDRLILLYDGRVVFQGSARQCVPYFASRGFRCPSSFNPADFLLDLLSVAPLASLPLACPQSSRSLTVQAELEQELQHIRSLSKKSVSVDGRGRSGSNNTADSRENEGMAQTRRVVRAAVTNTTPARPKPSSPHSAAGGDPTARVVDSVVAAAGAGVVAAETDAARASRGGGARRSARESLKEAAAAATRQRKAKREGEGGEVAEEQEGVRKPETQPPAGRSSKSRRDSDTEDEDCSETGMCTLQGFGAAGRADERSRAPPPLDSRNSEVLSRERREVKRGMQGERRSSRSSPELNRFSRAGSLVSIRPTARRRRRRRSPPAPATRGLTEEETPETAATAGTAADAERTAHTKHSQKEGEDEKQQRREAAGRAGETATRSRRKTRAATTGAEMTYNREGLEEVDEERGKDELEEESAGEDAETEGEEEQEEEEEESGIHRALVDEREVQMLAEYYAESAEAKQIEEQVQRCLCKSREQGLVHELGREPRAIALKRMFRSRRWGDYVEETCVLTYLSLLNLLRNPLTTLVQLALNLTLATVVGVIFFDVGGRGDTIETARSAFGVIYFITSQSCFGPLDCLSLFCEDRELFNRDTANANYRPLSFFLAKSLATLPFQHVPITFFFVATYWMCGLHPSAARFFVFLSIAELGVFCSTSFLLCISCASPRTSVTHAVAPILLVILQAVAGYYVRIEDIPRWVSWLRYVSFSHYAYAAMASNQYRAGEVWAGFTSEALLNSVGGLVNPTLSFNITMLAVLSIVYRILAFLLLKYTNRNIGLEA